MVLAILSVRTYFFEGSPFFGGSTGPVYDKDTRTFAGTATFGGVNTRVTPEALFLSNLDASAYAMLPNLTRTSAVVVILGKLLKRRNTDLPSLDDVLPSRAAVAGDTTTVGTAKHSKVKLELLSPLEITPV